MYQLTKCHGLKIQVLSKKVTHTRSSGKFIRCSTQGSKSRTKNLTITHYRESKTKLGTIFQFYKLGLLGTHGSRCGPTNRENYYESFESFVINPLRSMSKSCPRKLYFRAMQLDTSTTMMPPYPCQARGRHRNFQETPKIRGTLLKCTVFNLIIYIL